MRRRQGILPLIAAWGLGLVCMILRGLEWRAGVNEQTRLFAPSVYTWVLCAAAAAAILLFVRLSCRPPRGREGGIHGGTGTEYVYVNAAAAALLIAAGAVGLWQQLRAYKKSAVAIAAFVLCFLAAAAVIAAAKKVARDERADRFAMLLMLPSLCTLLWLVARYQEFAREPVLLFYVWRLLALSASVLGVYFMVSLSMGRAGAARVGATSLTAVFLTLTAFGDHFMYQDLRPHLVPMLMDAFALAYLSAQAWLLLREGPDQHHPKEGLEYER